MSSRVLYVEDENEIYFKSLLDAFAHKKRKDFEGILVERLSIIAFVSREDVCVINVGAILWRFGRISINLIKY